MSQNSPNGDPSSFPSLSASSPTSTTSKKRMRASAEQLAVLEDTFLTNQSPNSKVREILAKKVKCPSGLSRFGSRTGEPRLSRPKSTLSSSSMAMKAQHLSNCAAAGIPPQPLYAFNPSSGASVKPFPMGGHLHPAALAVLLWPVPTVTMRLAQVPSRQGWPRFGHQCSWRWKIRSVQRTTPFGIQQPGHPSFAFRPNVPQAMGAAARGVKRSFDGVNGPISAGAVLKPLHFPGAVGVDGLPEGIASLDMMFAAGMVPTASQIPIMPTFNCDNLAIGT